MANQKLTASVIIETAKAQQQLKILNGEIRHVDAGLKGLGKTLRATQGDLNAAVASISKMVTASQQASKATIESSKAQSAANRLAQTDANKGAAISRKNATEQTAAARIATEAAKQREISERRTSNAALTTARTNAVNQASMSRATAEQDRAARSSENYERRQRALRASQDAMGNSLSNQRYLFYDIGATYRTAALAAGALSAATTALAVSYEKDFAQVLRTSGLAMHDAGGQSEVLRKQIKDLGAEIPLSFGELSNIAMIGGQMDVPTEQLGKFTDTVAKFVATADGMNIDSATQMFGRLSSVFNTDKWGNIIDESFFDRIGSAISKTADNSVTSEKAITEMLNKMAALSKQAGLSVENTTALASALSSVGIQPYLASGSLTRYFRNLNNTIAGGGKPLDDYSKALGMTADEVKSLRATDPMALFTKLLTTMQGMDSIQQTQFLKKMGINGSQDPRVIQALAAQLPVLDKSMRNVNEAFADGSYLNASSAGIFDTTAAKLTRLVNTFKNLGDTIGRIGLDMFGPIIGAIGDMTANFASFVETTPGVAKALSTIASVLGVLAAALAFKSLLAFASAGLLGLQHAAQSSTGSFVSMSASGRRLAETLLATRGASAALTASILGQTTGMAALRAAWGMSTAQIANGGEQMERTGSRASRMGASIANAGKSMLSMAGGPVGVLTIAIGGLITAFITSRNSAQEAADAITSSFGESAAAGAEKLAKEIQGIGLDLWSYGASPEKWGKTMEDAFEAVGLEVGRTSEAIAGGVESTKRLRDEMNAAAKAGGATDANADYYRMIATFLDKVIEKQEKDGRVKENLKGTTAELSTETDGLAGAFDATGEAIAGETDELDKLSGALNTAIAAVFGMTDAQGGLRAAMSNLGEGLAKGTSFSSGDEQGSANLSNLQAVLQAQAQVLDQNIKAGKIGAEQAAKEYASFVSGLMTDLVARGVNPTEIQGLAQQTVGAVQDTFYNAAASGGLTMQISAETMNAEQQVEGLVGYLNSTFSGQSYDAYLALQGGDAASQQAYYLMEYLMQVTGMDYTAVVNALTEPAGKEGQMVAQYLDQIINGGKFEAAIGADTSVGGNNVQTFATWAQGLLNQLQSNINTVASNAESLGGTGVDGQVTQADEQRMMRASQAKSNPLSDIITKGYKDVQAKAIPTYKSLGNAIDQGYKKGAAAAKQAAGGGSKAAKAAKDTGDAAKKAGDEAKRAANTKEIEKLKRAWDEAEQAVAGYGSRVATGFGYVQTYATGVQEAKDNYYSLLNSEQERLNGINKSIKDLRSEAKKLKADLQVDKNKQANYTYLSQLAASYGDTERAKYYADEAKAQGEAVKEKKAQIKANESEAKSLEGGIGNLKKYSQAAIDNRNAVRQLEKAALDVAIAYANSGAGAKKVKEETIKWTGIAKDNAKQLGYTKKDVEGLTGTTKAYIEMLKKIPTSKQITITEKRISKLEAQNNTKSATDGAKKNIGSVPSSKNTKLGGTVGNWGAVDKKLKSVGAPMTKTVKLALKPGYAPGYAGAITYVAPNGKQQSGGKLVVNNKGGFVGADQRMSGFANGGMIPGSAPSDPRVDNLFASVDNMGMVKVRSGEYIQSEPAVKYYGQDFMDKVNKMQLPKYWAGGSIGGGGKGNGNIASVVDLSAATIQAIARAAAPEIALYVDSQKLATSVNDGNAKLAQRGYTS